MLLSHFDESFSAVNCVLPCDNCQFGAVYLDVALKVQQQLLLVLLPL
jgi:hypothetical protein